MMTCALASCGSSSSSSEAETTSAAATEAATEASTEAATEEETEKPTEKETEKPTEKETEKATEKETEPVTEAATEDKSAALDEEAHKLSTAFQAVLTDYDAKGEAVYAEGKNALAFTSEGCYGMADAEGFKKNIKNYYANLDNYKYIVYLDGGTLGIMVAESIDSDVLGVYPPVLKASADGYTFKAALEETIEEFQE